ncbi:hypothetical protein HZH68_007595 [Vespula germanica]|uniref:Uncharacterized protein n=1 Tax=Vespula germanica TaxID=30212 RepID=A0A834N9J4_VESGE|nr:hypothetical protein HZH68_007595 [Vespula germanica]
MWWRCRWNFASIASTMQSATNGSSTTTTTTVLLVLGVASVYSQVDVSDLDKPVSTGLALSVCRSVRTTTAYVAFT